MPIYEYKCSSCDRQFEVMQRMSDAPLATCETCGGDLEKLLSAPAFQFKGSGWYVTDYAKSGDQKDSGKDEEGKSDDASSSKKDASDKSDSSSKSDSKGAGTSAGDSKSSAKTSSTKAD